ncbi:MAG: phosphatidate cytidylyltransferase [Pseudomonadota bacterium]
MLRNRIITALILAPVVLAVVFLSNIQTFAAFFWFVIALGCYEWAGLLGLQARWARLGYVLGFALLALGLMVYPTAQTWALWAAGALWILAIFAVLTYPRSAGVFAHSLVLAPVGLVILSGAWVSLVTIRELPQGAWWIGWVLLMVWAADIGAYFAGKKFGRRLLAPKVSPGKTWEGVLGGYLLSVGVSGVAVALWQPQALIWLLGP